MFRLIVQKELRQIIGSTQFAVTFGVSALLILLTFYVGVRNYQLNRTHYETALSENLRQMEGINDWLQVEQHIFLPPQPLEALVPGIANDIGRNMQVQGRGDLAAQDSRFNSDPLFAVFRFLDLDFVFQIVLSLFAILFVYNAVSGEKEQGTLRLSFTNAIPRDSYLLGKAVGSFLAMAVPLLIPILLGCLMFPLMGVPMSGADWARLGLIVLAGLLFLGVFLNLSLLVSALTQRSSSSFLALLVLWILAVLIVPRSSVLLAGRAVDVISSDEMAFRKARRQSQLWEEDKGRISQFQPTSQEASKMMEEFNAYMQQIADEREAKMREFSGRLQEQRRNQESVRRRWALALARLSPASSFSLAAMNLAGTSIELGERYREQALAYQQSYGQFIRQKTGGLSGGGMIIRVLSADQKEPDPIDPHEIPPFVFEAAPLNEVVRAALPDLGLLGLFNLLLFGGAFAAFLRYDVR